jgi:hypothetical protein
MSEPAVVSAPARRQVTELLNTEQQAAVLHGDTPLLVVAGAGSGKTMMLAARVARLVLDGADPRRILLMTFSRRAAAELERRAGRLLHQALGLRGSLAPPDLPWAGTFHSVAARLLRDHAAQLGLAPDFSVVDRSDAEELLAQLRTRLDLHDSERRFPLARTCMAILSRTLNSAQPLAEVLASHYPWCAEWQADLDRLFSAYTQAKQAQRVLDYDDLLLYWHLALQEAPVARAMGARFDHVLVDEFQDTNRLQAGILHALKPDGRGVTVVGDDAQSIYAFRAAEVGNMLGFPQRFSPAAAVLSLQRNYRSTQPLLAAANAVIAQASQRFAKTLWSDKASLHKPQLVHVHDEADQARWVADEVLRQREEGTRLTQQAVLFRTSQHSAALELELARRGIPFVKFGGLRFLEAAHIKDAVSLLRWTHNLRCRLAGFRVARLVNGIGPAAALQLLDCDGRQRRPGAGVARLGPAPARPARLAGAARHLHGLDGARRALAGRHGTGHRLAAGPAAAPVRRRRPRAQRRPGPAGPAGGRLPEPGALPDRTDAGPTRGQQRRGRAAAPRRGLPDPVDHPFGQGPGMAFGARAQRGRRLHAGRPGHRQHGRDRRGTPPALRGHDTGPGAAAPAAAPAVPCHATAGPRQPAPVRSALAFHPVGAGRFVRYGLADTTQPR